ncbi:MAG: hypothetical protein ACP5VP_04750 [Candidatus Limnocylindrales bacterium]
MTGRRGPLARLVASIALTGGLALSVSSAGAAAASPGGPALVAYLGAQRIPFSTAASYHCHDREYPVIRCFHSRAELEADEQGAPTPTLAPQQLLSPFVRWFQDANYVGAFLDAYDPYPDLSVIGWEDQIGSFTPVNGSHPIWFQGANYTGVMWDWGTSPEATLGNADNRIVSVQKK